jgi:tRNA nucleotidyltransferase (CCA-adding enzyme)
MAEFSTQSQTSSGLKPRSFLPKRSIVSFHHANNDLASVVQHVSHQGNVAFALNLAILKLDLQLDRLMEQATIIKVFLRRKGFSPQAFDVWYNQKKKTFMEEKARKKKEKAEMKAAQPKK